MHGGLADKPARSRATIWIGTFVLVVGSIVLSLVIVEIGLRILAPQPMSGTVLEYAPRGYSVNRSSGSALFSVGDRKGVYHFVWPHLRGLRPPSASAERILALGDSFTFGVGLPEEDTFVGRLQKNIDAAFGSERIALLNAWIGGSGTAEHLAFVEDFGDVISPRAVFVFVSFDDFNRAQRSPLYRLRNASTLDLEDGTAPTSRLKSLVSHSAIYDFSIQHIHVAQLLRNTILRILYPADLAHVSPAAQEETSTGRSPPDQQRLARALFRRLRAWCDSRHVKLAVINNGWRSYDWLPRLLESERIVHFDAASEVQPVIARDQASYIIPGDGHPNAEGAKLIADAVWPFVRSFINDSGLDKPGGDR
jgi:lysophospholipase L1-like esterase